MKRNRKSMSLVLLVLVILTLSSCSSKKNNQNNEGGEKESNSPQNTVEATVDPTSAPTHVATAEPTIEPVLTEEERIKKEMVDRSLLRLGNNERLHNVIEKARRGEDVTVGFIGGSITEGFNAGTEDIFAKLTYEYFADTYGNRDTVHYVNAGLSGTPSMLGLIRAERDLFTANPDLIFIEFAVNDARSLYDEGAFESLIVECLNRPNSPAVVLLFSVIENGYTCQQGMQLIGFQYDLPMISITNALQPEFDAGRMVWDDWSNDVSHPNEWGQKLYSEFIINYLNKAAEKEKDQPVKMPSKFFVADYTNMKMADKTNLEVTSLGSFVEKSTHPSFENGWMKEKDVNGNEPFTFTFTGRSLFIVFKQVNSEDYGTAEVFVDGEMKAAVSGGSSSGWNNPMPQFVFSEEESKTHTVSIKMGENHKDLAFSILAFGISE